MMRPPQHGAEQAADAADDDGDEARHDQAVAHRRRQPEDAGGEHARQAGEHAAEAEIQRAQLVDVDAERGDGLQVARAGADADAEQRVAQQQIEPDRGRRGDRR